MLLLLELQVGPYNGVPLYIEPTDGVNEELMIYVTDPGEEYFMHQYLWRTIPFSFSLGAQIEAVDVTLKKVETHRDENCNADEAYSYIGIPYFQYIYSY